MTTKPRTSSLLIALVLLISGLVAAPPASADPVVEAPVVAADGAHEISTAGQLLFLSHNYGTDEAPESATYRLTADIDMAGVTDYRPFGRFRGVFDGDHHVISNLTINRPDSGTVGFFNHLGDSESQGTIRDTGFDNIQVTGANTVGAIAGMHWGTIEGVWARGSVTGNSHSLGGLAGRIPADTSGTNTQPDPVLAAHPTIRNSISMVQVNQDGTGDSQGGLAGRVLNPRATIENSYTAAPVMGYNRAGGLAGDMRFGELRNAVAVNPIVHGERATGAVAGRVLDAGTSSGNLQWDGIQLPVGANGVASDSAPIGDEAVASQSTYEALGWDFGNVWEMRSAPEGDYPALRGFDSIPYPFELSAFRSAVDFTIEASDVESDSMTISAVDVTAGGEPVDAERISEICVVVSTTLPDAEPDCWSEGAVFALDGLEPTTKYTVWAKIRTIDEVESGWRFGNFFTKYVVETDPSPFDINVTITENPDTTAQVNWQTRNIDIDDPVVELTVPGQAWPRVIEGSSVVTEVNLTENEAVFDAIRQFHTATVDDLTPKTTYTYRVGDRATGAWGPSGSFTTAGEGDFQFIYMTDPQVQMNNAALTLSFEQAMEKAPEAVFTYLAGDLTEKGYAEGQFATFFESAQPALLQMKFASALGNHDRETLTNLHFNYPETVLPNVWSFDYGDVHFAILNTEYDEGEELQAQLDWLREDMAATDRTWRVVGLHKALYAATDHVDDDDINRLRRDLAPVLEEVGVDVVLMGHDHNFSRGFVVEGDDATPSSTIDALEREVFDPTDAPMYIVNGIAGSSKWYKQIEYDADALDNVAPDYRFIDKTSSTFEAALHQQFFTVVDVTDTSFELETWSFKYDSGNPGAFEVEPYLFDSIVLTQEGYEPVTQPEEPVDPAEPADPTDPVDPTEPVDPTDPADPAEEPPSTEPTVTPSAPTGGATEEEADADARENGPVVRPGLPATGA